MRQSQNTIQRGLLFLFFSKSCSIISNTIIPHIFTKNAFCWKNVFPKHRLIHQTVKTKNSKTVPSSTQLEKCRNSTPELNPTTFFFFFFPFHGYQKPVLALLSFAPYILPSGNQTLKTQSFHFHYLLHLISVWFLRIYGEKKKKTWNFSIPNSAMIC